MSADTPNRDAIFWAAVEIASAEDRAAYIAQDCGGDAELLAEVEQLVNAHFQAGSFLEEPAMASGWHVAADESASTATCHPLAERPGTVIGSYKLLQLIGEGGMGAVYLAEQAQPVRRKVALKLIKPGLDSAQVIARFEAERQALALMDHPNIAKVLDAGAAESDRPFFVMELVKGVSITRFCDERRLTPRQRLELFVPVCQAVQHAHQKGVIHRDLKPSNVLVALYDGVSVPKVIDFGVAKAAGQALTERTLCTVFGAVVGTLEYMSPEQAELNQLDVDTRSDIYSLGVLMYELLTGTTPIQSKRLKGAALLEMLRMIREEEPPRPSKRLSTTEELPAIAARRGLEPRRLSGLVRGELDWIVMKCLEKERGRRYETANGLARDLERYLRDEPVQACPPSVGYSVRKFLRRNRGPALAAALVLLALVVGIIGTTWGLIRAVNAEGAAVNLARQKEAALTAAQQSERHAQDELLQALIHQVRAGRAGGQAGQRFGGLKALAQAAGIARARGYDKGEFLKLRNEAVACLALPDVRYERTLVEDLRQKTPEHYWIAFDPLFHHFVYSDREGNLSIRRVGDGKETAALPGPHIRPKWVNLKVSPDGGWLRVSYDMPDGPAVVSLWEFRDGKLGRRVALEHDCAFSPDISADGRLVAGARPDGSIGVYETASGREVKRIAEGMGAAGVTFHPDGRQLAVTLPSEPRVVVVIDLETGKEVARYPHPEPPTDALAWRGDGRLLAVPCQDQRIYVWDHAGRRLQSVLEGHTSLGITVRFSHAGEFLISHSWDGSTRFWDPVSGRQLLRATVNCLAIRGDGRQMALSKDDHLQLWEVAGGWECRTLHHGLVGNRTPRPADWGPRNLDFSPDGRLLASASLDGARLWDMATFTEVGHLPTGRTASVLFHPDGESLFTHGDNGLQRWPIRREGKPDADRPEGVEVLQVGPPQSLDVPGSWNFAYLSRDREGRRLAAVDAPRGRAIVLDLKDLGHTLVLEDLGMTACALSQDGRWALTWTRNVNEAIKVWDASDGKPVPWQPPAGDKFAFLTPDGCWLATSPPGDAPFRFWRLGSWQPGPTLSKDGRKDHGVAPSPDGSLLYWSGLGSELSRLVHAGTGKELAALEPPRDAHHSCIQFSPDGTRLATGTDNHTIHVWDLRAIRRGLGEIGLDWDLPAYPPPDPKGDARPLRIDVKKGSPAPD